MRRRVGTRAAAALAAVVLASLFAVVTDPPPPAEATGGTSHSPPIGNLCNPIVNPGLGSYTCAFVSSRHYITTVTYEGGCGWAGARGDLRLVQGRCMADGVPLHVSRSVSTLAAGSPGWSRPRVRTSTGAPGPTCTAAPPPATAPAAGAMLM